MAPRSVKVELDWPHPTARPLKPLDAKIMKTSLTQAELIAHFVPNFVAMATGWIKENINGTANRLDSR